MKQIIAIALLLFVFCRASFAVIWFFIDAPQDDRDARKRVGDRSELKSLHADYTNIIQAKLWPLKFDQAAKIFGPKLDTITNWWGYGANSGDKRSGPKVDRYPANLVLPLFASAGGTNCGWGMMMMVSGMHTGDPAKDKSHTDLYAVGDIAYVELYSQLGGEKVQTAAIYFRADKNFVPLKSTNDFNRRLKWDKAKFDALKRWFDAHLVPGETTRKRSAE